MFTYLVKIGLVLFLFYSSLGVKAEIGEYLKPQATVIVIPDKPDPFENKSAILLNYWLKKIYGTDSGFVVKRESLIKIKEGEFLIAIGKTQFSAA